MTSRAEVLSALDYDAPRSHKDVADALRADPEIVSVMLGNLQRAGLCKREPNGWVRTTPPKINGADAAGFVLRGDLAAVRAADAAAKRIGPSLPDAPLDHNDIPAFVVHAQVASEPATPADGDYSVNDRGWLTIDEGEGGSVTMERDHALRLYRFLQSVLPALGATK